MAPKTKYSKEEILETALNITRERGISAVTSRELGAVLGTSTRPIFTAFPNMQDLLRNIEMEAKETYNRYIDKGLEHKYPFMGVGLQFVQFAMDEPQLYRLLFMTKLGEQADNIQSFIMSDENYQLTLDALKDSYHVEEEEAKWLYRHSFVYVSGLASLYITGIVSLSIEEVFGMLNEMFSRWIRGVEV